ncbi:hypothetical protein N0V95_003616 [Ascochyta clinopodiicola]|nr:hypothetical protein N0V95_003616 [Ascochyta clinopodiicola]
MKGICTATPPTPLPLPVNEAGALELVVARDDDDDDEREVDARVMEDSSADKLDSMAPSPDGATELSATVTLGTAPTRLANVVASAGVEKTSVLLSWAKTLDAALSSVAVVV